MSIIHHVSILDNGIESMDLNFIFKHIKGNGRSVIVKKNILASFVIKGISILVSFLLVPITIGYVSAELYGVWLALSSIIYWIHIMDLGFSQGLKNKLAEAIADNDWQRGKSLVSTTYIIISLIIIPVGILLELLIPFINWCSLLNVSPVYYEEIVQVLRVLVVFVCIQMIVNVLTNVVAAFQRVAFSSLFAVIGQIIALLVIILLTKTMPPSLMGLAFAYSAVPVLVFIIASALLYSKRYKMVAPDFKSFDKSYINDIVKLGFKFFILNIQVVVLYQATNILISNVSSPLQVTSYNIAYKYVHTAMMVYLIVISPLWPAYTDAYARRDYSWMRYMRNKMAKILCFCIVAIVLMVAISPFVYQIWIGERANVPLIMTCLVAIYVCIYCWSNLNGYLLNGMGKLKLATYIACIGMVIHIPLSLYLSQYIGAYGVITSMILINLVYAIFFYIQVNLILSRRAKGIWLE